MKIAKIRAVKTPTRGTGGSAGLDFYIPDDIFAHFDNLLIEPLGSLNIPSGIVAEVPKGHALVAMNKSGIALGLNLQVGACVIDEDYQGEIHLHLFNVGIETIKLWPGQKIVQFICVPVNYVEIEEVRPEAIHIVETERGTGGFGSTNKCSKCNETGYITDGDFDMWPCDCVKK